MYVIMTCEDSDYKIEYRTHTPDSFIALVDTDVLGDPITDIECYTITDNGNNDYTIVVDKNKWMDNLANGIYDTI